jgi:hypothetical protein
MSFAEYIDASGDAIFSWTGREAGIEFLYVTADSCIVPVEVKSGK